jgi:hypothetical protein
VGSRVDCTTVGILVELEGGNTGGNLNRLPSVGDCFPNLSFTNNYPLSVHTEEGIYVVSMDDRSSNDSRIPLIQQYLLS